MGLHIYRYGESRRLPGFSIGVTRFPPRGVKRADYARRGYCDFWMPLLAPSRKLVGLYKAGKIPFAVLARRYHSEMREPAPRQAIELVAALASRQQINLGCFCADPKFCHRSLLRDLIAGVAPDAGSDRVKRSVYSSPACAMPEIED
jgi:uncharacterized protein YeaO (DUF488 family)